MLSAVDIDWIAVVIAIVISMAVGSILYAPPVMGRWWMRQVGIDPSRQDTAAATRALGIAIALSVVMAIAFAVIFGWTGASGVGEGAMVGALAGIAFGVPIGVVHPTFEGRALGVGLLYGAHHVVEYVLIGIVFGWRA
ncbi:MAG TPA: DUF1761 domain-containing protein [Candidatus Thermoplasmatota archaeon]|nr:DUF1761 domain-containing protein [Candidatus Thermoplasmatota archaeon]